MADIDGYDNGYDYRHHKFNKGKTRLTNGISHFVNTL